MNSLNLVTIGGSVRFTGEVGQSVVINSQLGLTERRHMRDPNSQQFNSFLDGVEAFLLKLYANDQLNEFSADIYTDMINELYEEACNRYSDE